MLTTPPPVANEVAPEESNVLTLVSPVNVVIPVTSRVPPTFKAPEAVRSVTVVAPAPNVPVVTTFWAPKSGAIFVPAIAAFVFTSTLTISSSNILAEVTASFAKSPTTIVPSSIIELSTLLAPMDVTPALLIVTSPLKVTSCAAPLTSPK